MKHAEKRLVTVSAMETRMNKGNKKSMTEWVNMFSPGSICCSTENFASRYITGEY